MSSSFYAYNTKLKLEVGSYISVRVRPEMPVMPTGLLANGHSTVCCGNAVCLAGWPPERSDNDVGLN